MKNWEDIVWKIKRPVKTLQVGKILSQVSRQIWRKKALRKTKKKTKNTLEESVTRLGCSATRPDCAKQCWKASFLSKVLKGLVVVIVGLSASLFWYSNKERCFCYMSYEVFRSISRKLIKLVVIEVFLGSIASTCELNHVFTISLFTGKFISSYILRIKVCFLLQWQRSC